MLGTAFDRRSAWASVHLCPVKKARQVLSGPVWCGRRLQRVEGLPFLCVRLSESPSVSNHSLLPILHREGTKPGHSLEAVQSMHARLSLCAPSFSPPPVEPPSSLTLLVSFIVWQQTFTVALVVQPKSLLYSSATPATILRCLFSRK